MPEKILIIDDDIDTLKLVGLMLQRQGYEISAASSGEQGIAKAQTEKPDVILLDVMMPDMDGYEVARRLKRDPRTGSMPILMFTARTQLDDKVTAFEVGADDYLTKPTNPTELQTHVRALLARASDKSAVPGAPAPLKRHGRPVAVLAARGGLGVTTLAVNLAAALRSNSRLDVILAEFTPGQGTLGLELGMPYQRALNELLAGDADQITSEKVGASLLPHSSGIRLLLASENPRDISLQGQTRQFEVIFDRLVGLASFVVLDLGSALPPIAERVLPLCTNRIVVTDAAPNTVTHTRILLDEIIAMGIDPADITVVLNNRVRFEAQQVWTEIQRSLGHPISVTLTPASDLMLAAARRHLPGVLAMPENVTSQQILKLADKIAVPKTTG
jgi:DNA-binding response OmpR family regulator